MLKNNGEEAGIERIDYIDALRTIACFAVVMLHVSAQNTYYVDFKSHEWNVFMLYESIVNWAVPVFIMLSGAVMLRKVYECIVLRHKLFRIFCIFYIWSFVYLVSDILMNSAVDYSENALWFQVLLQGHYHMWYLIVLFGLYLTVPIIKTIADNIDALKLFTLLSVVFTFIIPSVKDFPQIEGIKGVLQLPIIGALYRAFDNVTADTFFYLTLGFVSYYMFGYIIVHHLTISNNWQFATAMICLLIGTAIVFLEIRFSVSKEAAGLFLRYYQVGIAAQACGIMIMAKGLRGKKIVRHFAQLSPLTLGIYMIHPLIIEILQ